MDKDSKIYVAGHRGMVGSAIVRELEQQGYTNIVTRTHGELDLCRQADVERFFAEEKPEYVIDAAALVGGIKANSERPAEFMYVNMQIQQNLIWAAFESGVKKFLFLSSACMYPKECPQPMKEEYLLTGLPEVTNEGYALAKICGSRLCSYINREYGREFISAIPANSYGIGDSFDPEHSHVIPALLMKYHRAKQNGDKKVVLWGTGTAKREFINNRDIASACIFLLENYSSAEPINVGTGEEVTIMELSQMIKRITGYEGDIVTDPTKPDGMMRRICDNSRIFELGWKAEVSLEDGIKELDKFYLNFGGLTNGKNDVEGCNT